MTPFYFFCQTKTYKKSAKTIKKIKNFNKKGINMSDFSKNLKELRIEKGLSQQELAQIFNVTQSTVAKWESGDREPNFSILIQVAKFFEVSTDTLLGLKDL